MRVLMIAHTDLFETKGFVVVESFNEFIMNEHQIPLRLGKKETLEGQ
jgi:hypothetical protein